MRMKAFTLVELMVVMMLTALLILLAGGIFYYLSQYSAQIMHKALPVNELSRIHYLLENDVALSDKVEFNGDTLKFMSDRPISYVLMDSVMLRIQSPMIDTFSIKAQLKEIELTDGAVTSCNLEYRDHYNRLGNILLTKTYSSAQLLKFANTDEPE